jgi:hypothetical protein
MPWRHMGERTYSSYSYFSSATRGGWVVCVTTRPRFTPGERTPSTHWTGGWVGPRAGLDVGSRRKILCPCRGSNSDSPARSQTLYCLNYRGSWKVIKFYAKSYGSNIFTRIFMSSVSRLLQHTVFTWIPVHELHTTLNVHRLKLLATST